MIEHPVPAFKRTCGALLPQALSGEWGSNEEQDLVDAMRRAVDLGINFFDTAQAYGFGAAEQIVGKALEPEIKTAGKRWSSRPRGD